MPPKEIRFYRTDRPHGYLSNLYKSSVCINIKDFGLITFPSAEHAYQFLKPKDPDVSWWILDAPKPRFAAGAGHGLFYYDVRPGWKDLKVGWMRIVVRAKFDQHKNLATHLIKTADARLIEQSPADYFWGVGDDGSGKNWLGRILMEVRRSIRRRDLTATSTSS